MAEASVRPRVGEHSGTDAKLPVNISNTAAEEVSDKPYLDSPTLSGHGNYGFHNESEDAADMRRLGKKQEFVSVSLAMQYCVVLIIFWGLET